MLLLLCNCLPVTCETCVDMHSEHDKSMLIMNSSERWCYIHFYIPVKMGRRKCQVSGCDIVTGGSFRLYSFPSDCSIKRSWQEYVVWTHRLSTVKYIYNENHRICGRHFPVHHFTPGRKLDYKAVPCKHPSREDITDQSYQTHPKVTLITAKPVSVSKL